MTPRVKEIVTAAIARGQALITVWPNSFPSIVEAENYVSDTLEWKRFRYGVLPDSSYFFKMQVRSRTHYGIVMEAHQKGQFKLAKPPPHRAELRNAIQEGIQETEAAINWYPKSFQNTYAAQNYVKNIQKNKNIRYKGVGSVHPGQVAVYVGYHTMRRAYEAGKFTLAQKPKNSYRAMDPEWSGSSTKKPFKSSSQTISTPTASPPNSSVEFSSPKRNDSKSYNPERTGGGEEKNYIQKHDQIVDVSLDELSTTSLGERAQERVPIQLVDVSDSPCCDHDLIDLKSPELGLLSCDLIALIDIFNAEPGLVKDNGFNELVSDIHNGKLVWHDR